MIISSSLHFRRLGLPLLASIVISHHHEPRNQGEESPRMPGFEWVGIKISPRNALNNTP